jgi:hypothetical protein
MAGELWNWHSKFFERSANTAAAWNWRNLETRIDAFSPEIINHPDALSTWATGV